MLQIGRSTLLTTFLCVCMGLSLYSCKGKNQDIDPPYSIGQHIPIGLSRAIVHFDTIPSNYLSATLPLTFYNRTKETIGDLSIRLMGGEQSEFQVNVDGRGGRTYWPEVSIGPKDSLLLLVRVFLKPTQTNQAELVTDNIEISQGGKLIGNIPLKVYRQNVHEVDELTINQDTQWTSDRPWLIHRKVYVAPNARWTLPEGCKLWMHSEAKIEIGGTMISQGTATHPVEIVGVRKDNLLPHIPYSRIPGGWHGISFTPTSRGNQLSYLRLSGSVYGLSFAHHLPEHQGEDIARLDHCLITNTTQDAFSAGIGRYQIEDSELSNAGGVCLKLRGGAYTIRRSTVVNLSAWSQTERGLALDYSSLPPQAGGEQPNTSASLEVVHSVIDGSTPVYKGTDDHQQGGALRLDPKHIGAIQIRQSYLNSILYPSLLPQIIWQENILAQRTDTPELSYKRICKGTDGKQDFLYDFRPTLRAPFAGKLSGADTTLDLDGKARTGQQPYGAYIYSPN